MIQFKIIFWMTIVFWVMYLPRVRCWFAPFKKQERLVNYKKNKFAVLIPARNEGSAVLPLFESLCNQTYAKEKYDVYVIVKEQDDPVREYAKQIHATAFVDEKQTCKGDCLDYALRSILKTKPDTYDAYVIVDADCILQDTFLEEMNNAMVSGAQVINGKKLVKNYYTDNGENSNIITACNGLIWTLMDDMGNRFKSDHGYTTMTISTGILLRSDLVKQWNGWIYNKTLTEDMELQRDCGVQNYKTFYYEKALLYMEEAPAHEETNKRRKRWMTGLIASDKIYFGDLVNKKSIYDLVNNYYLFCLWSVYLYIGGLFAMMILNLLGAAGTVFFRPEMCHITVRRRIVGGVNSTLV